MPIDPDIPKRVALAYDRQALTGDAASRDVIQQMDAVEAVLGEAGSECLRVGADLDLAAFKRELLDVRPDLVFNLVESLDGSDRLQSLVPMLLEDWRIPFTGCGSFAMQLSNDKLRSKECLARAGLPVAGCAWLDDGGLRFFPEPPAKNGEDYIVKAVDAHASLHMDDASVIRNADAPALAHALAEARRRHGGRFFAERFIDGREFNLSLLGVPAGGPEVLPPAEILFTDLSADRPRIVGYAAKWDEASDEYQGTPRTFEFPDGDRALLADLRDGAKRAWHALSLTGYARVDFRVDAEGRPFILEANTNPCLAPDAGLAAAAERAGLGFDGLVRRILRAVNIYTKYRSINPAKSSRT